MSGQELSATDAALRERIHELSVHIPCGTIRGPVHAWKTPWQSCPCEDSPAKWEQCDVSQVNALCIVCRRGTAGGRSRWSWLACDNCRAVNSGLEKAWGLRPLALGRHSLMNGIGVGGGAPPEVQEHQVARLEEFATRNGGLREWTRTEYARLAGIFDPLADVPLTKWQEVWPPSWAASWDAVSRFLDVELPLKLPTSRGGVRPFSGP
jgi:hypothetical protein